MALAPLHRPEPIELAHPLAQITQRPRVRGKFLYVGDEKFWVKGVTYGTFRPNAQAQEYPARQVVEKDFAAMAYNGINTLRTYTVPPRWLLDTAREQGLRVMVGIAWEEHITFLDERARAQAIIDRVGNDVRRIAGHPALLCYAVGNEIPAPIVRWHGRRRIEGFLHRLYGVAKREDPTALVTYVNFPTTEYLVLPFIDLVCFNVYLESEQTLAAYLARLHNLCEERPLLMAEIGLDSLRNGEDAQAKVLDWQIRTIFSSGCCGAFVYAWTDEWYRGGYDIEDWNFGLTTRNRGPKPALEAVRAAFAQTPVPADIRWPKVSVVVCSFNGAETIQDTLEGLQGLDYPDFEVIVVNDGSTDRTAEISARYPVRLISTENRGLSNARNTGMGAANGEIVAYIDDDAYPDPHWLSYLALSFVSEDYVGVGGPNLAPPGDGPIADCVANAPGGPVHVLLSDRVAEHIPGCNMAFRKAALVSVGGFDPRYRAAGDDVDICWRLQQRGGVIGFSPAAVVWHHRRNALAMYWKQQQGYGKAEALLEEKWPQRYNAFGHTTWGGRLYGKGLTFDVGALRGRIYQGVWGSAPFQALYRASPNTWLALPLMPEWYLLIAALAVFSLLGVDWPPMRLFVPLLILAVALPSAQALLSVTHARFTSPRKSRWARARLYAITALLHLQQPLARLIGRITHGLTVHRQRGGATSTWPRLQRLSLWREHWQDPHATLEQVRAALADKGAVVNVGGDYDNWDLEVRGGLFARARLLLATEEHGGGKQLQRLRIVPRYTGIAIVLTVLFVALAFASAADNAYIASSGSGVTAALIIARSIIDSGFAVGLLRDTVKQMGAK